MLFPPKHHLNVWTRKDYIQRPPMKWAWIHGQHAEPWCGDF
jgi:hypothetical protein